MTATTPLHKQYQEIKQRYRDAILLFRIGDFYETFDDDARLMARELGIVLTSKPMGKNIRVPLAGVPHHSLERHLKRLIARGHRVAICEQLTDAPVKGERAATSSSATWCASSRPAQCSNPACFITKSTTISQPT